MEYKIINKYVIVSDEEAKKVIIYEHFNNTTVATLKDVQIFDEKKDFNTELEKLKDLDYEIDEDNI